MKQVSISRTEHSGSRLCETRVALREQVPLRDLADCLLAAYEGLSQRAFRLNQFRGTEPGSELKDWKNAEHDLLVTMPVDLAESDENFYALASIPGYTAAEISVAVEDRWLLISGYGHCSQQTELGAHDAEFDDRKGTRHPLEKHACDECDSQCNLEAGQSFQYGVVRRPFWLVEFGSKVDATRNVAVGRMVCWQCRWRRRLARTRLTALRSKLWQSALRFTISLRNAFGSIATGLHPQS
jgi:HSP20 family molecular chaperone IbpA